jgi:hypothetical protein
MTAYLWLGLSSIAALAVPPLRAITVNDMAHSTVNGDVCARNRDQGTFPFLVCKSCCTLKGDLMKVRQFSRCAADQLTVVPSFSLVRSRVVPAGTVMSLMTIAAQDDLPLIAAAASENVQLARASRFVGDAYASAPALRRREVTCMATIVMFE